MVEKENLRRSSLLREARKARARSAYDRKPVLACLVSWHSFSFIQTSFLFQYADGRLPCCKRKVYRRLNARSYIRAVTFGTSSLVSFPVSALLQHCISLPEMTIGSIPSGMNKASPLTSVFLACMLFRSSSYKDVIIGVSTPPPNTIYQNHPKGKIGQIPLSGIINFRNNTRPSCPEERPIHCVVHCRDALSPAMVLPALTLHNSLERLQASGRLGTSGLLDHRVLGDTLPSLVQEFLPRGYHDTSRWMDMRSNLDRQATMMEHVPVND